MSSFRISSITRLFCVPEHEPRLVAAQVKALSAQVPVLHAILSVDAIAVCYSHYGIAPDWLTIYPLGCLLVLCAARIVIWVRRPLEEGNSAKMVRQLRSTNRMAFVLGSGFACWATLLSRYGNAATQMHALFFLTITMIACVFCLMHLRSAAAIIGAIAIPVLPFYILSGNPVLAVTAINFATVTAVLMFMQSVFYRDFRRLVRLGEENGRLANMDALTGLPNRRFFFSRLQDQIAKAQGEGRAFAVGMIDLDGFKPVNDTFGHHAGDAVLRDVGRRLEGAMAETGWVARLGGDEFGLIIEGSPDLVALGRSLCTALQAPYMLRDATARIEASIGFVRFPEGGTEADLLVERADYALYYAKAHHRGTAITFTQDHASRLRSQGVIEQALRQADHDTEFTVVFQPIVDASTHETIAFEALARWDNPGLGRVSPADFIAVAERSGLIQRLTRTLLRKALAAMQDWPPGVQISFNLSTCDIASPEGLAEIAACIAESGIAPERIVFEVTETALMHDFADARQVLAALKAIGVAIALDDFGTGYSSLSYVHRLPIDKLKIDRGFTAEICEDQGCRDIVRSVVDLCRNLRIACVVEGVETAEQMMVLRALGCPSMQGYLLGRPMPAADVAGFLRREAGAPGRDAEAGVVASASEAESRGAVRSMRRAMRTAEA